MHVNVSVYVRINSFLTDHLNDNQLMRESWKFLLIQFLF